MDGNNNGISFRTSLSGFNKNDVIQYISDENSRFAAERASLEERINDSLKKVSESEKRLFDVQRSFNDLVKIKDAEIEKTEAELREKDKIISELSDKLAEKNTEYNSVLSETAKLRALLDSCEEQMKQYTERISVLEEGYSSRQSDDDSKLAEIDELKKENAYLKNKYVKLQSEYNSLREKLNSASESASGGALRTGSASERSYGKNNVEDISQKAIDTIKAINSDVKEYMDSCVGEFDTYSRDITVGISSLLEELAVRCRELNEKIRQHKAQVSDSIDVKFDGFNS